MLPGAPERVQSLLCQEAVSPALPSPELGLVGWGRQGREYEAGELIASSQAGGAEGQHFQEKCILLLICGSCPTLIPF